MSDRFQGIKGTPVGEYFVRWEASYDPADLLLPASSFIICDDQQAAWAAVISLHKFSDELAADESWVAVEPFQAGTDGYNRPKLPFFTCRLPIYHYKWGHRPSIEKVLEYCMARGPVLFRSNDYRNDVTRQFHEQATYRASDLVAKRIERPPVEKNYDISYCIVNYDPKGAARRRSAVSGAIRRKEMREKKKADAAKRAEEVATLKRDMVQMYEEIIEVVDSVTEHRVYKRFRDSAFRLGCSITMSYARYFYESCDPIGNLRRAVLAWRELREKGGWSPQTADPMTWPGVKKVLREAGRRRKKFNTEADPCAAYRQKHHKLQRAALRWLFAEIDKAYPGGRIPAERPRKSKTPAE